MIDSTGELVADDKKTILPMKSSNIQPNGLRLQRLFHGLCSLYFHLDIIYLNALTVQKYAMQTLLLVSMNS
jgi:hypothetical protein